MQGKSGSAERDGGWYRHRRSLVYQNEWIRVFHDDVIRPDGNPGIYGVVSYQSRSVGVVAIDDHDRVLLVGQHRYTIDTYSLEIPAGGTRDGEEPMQAAHRELGEETGYKAASMTLLLHAFMSNSISNEEGFCYLATGLSNGDACPDGTEDISVRWIGFADCLKMVRRGDITDALTILGLQQVAIMRQERALQQTLGSDTLPVPE